MTIRYYLITMALATLLCWMSWILVLVNIDPFATNAGGFALFYSSFFLSLVGTFALILFFFYERRWRSQAPVFKSVGKSVRESIIISGFITAGFMVWGNGWMSWWTGSLMLTAFILTVSLFISFAPPAKNNPVHALDNFV